MSARASSFDAKLAISYEAPKKDGKTGSKGFRLVRCAGYQARRIGHPLCIRNGRAAASFDLYLLKEAVPESIPPPMSEVVGAVCDGLRIHYAEEFHGEDPMSASRCCRSCI